MYTVLINFTFYLRNSWWLSLRRIHAYQPASVAILTAIDTSMEMGSYSSAAVYLVWGRQNNLSSYIRSTAVPVVQLPVITYHI